MMDIRGFSRRPALFTLALAICVLIPLSSFAQEQSKEQADFVKKSYVESPASGAAAPAPLPPAGNWTGVYIGGHIGGG